MTAWLLLGAALVLALERACYVWIARAPGTFRRVCARPAIAWIGTPVAVVGALFGVFKVVQGAVFLAWGLALGDGNLLAWELPTGVLALAAALTVGGQILNLGVFYRLGAVGVFFGDRLGRVVPWCRDFPFSWVSHPQYVGTVLTIWGVFLVMRFPHPDWYLLPALETVYYAVGAHLEAKQPGTRWRLGRPDSARPAAQLRTTAPGRGRRQRWKLAGRPRRGRGPTD